MFTLFVSYDAGSSYHKGIEAETLDELRPITEKHNRDMLRWYIEKDGKIYDEEVCSIHKGIIQFMERINKRAQPLR